MKKILFLLFGIFMLSGCNYRELNDLAIISGISVDKVDNQYSILIQVVNPTQNQETASSDEPDFITYTSKSNTLQEAFRNIILESPRKIYGSQMQVLVISERLAKEDLEGVLDFFFRDPEVRPEFYVVIERNNDNEALKTLTVLENLSSSNIKDSLDADASFLGTNTLVNYGDLINMYLDDNLEIILPSLYVKDNNDEGDNENNLRQTSGNSSIVISNLAVFKDNKLVGYLSKDESVAFNLIKGNIQNTLISYECDKDRYAVVEILEVNTKVEADVKEKKVKINIKGDASIKENNCKYDLTKSKEIKEIQNNINKKIKKEINSTIDVVKKDYNSDIFGFKDLFYKSNYKEFNKIKDSWYKDVFPNLDIETKVDINLIEKGNVIGGIHDK